MANGRSPTRLASPIICFPPLIGDSSANAAARRPGDAVGRSVLQDVGKGPLRISGRAARAEKLRFLMGREDKRLVRVSREASEGDGSVTGSVHRLR